MDIQEQLNQAGMDSFDRMFPNQDLLPKGGFGNLIALPLQKQAKVKGNSVFVNDSFQEFENQWKYLSSIKKISEKKHFTNSNKTSPRKKALLR
ncbi:TOTE conflict system archaeo-eukaryotic primase domain-containing protein [Halalkalibacter lacteus]|uniref:TOTE conflict system archaeo-eukaryotic primase domain-containing protein n=1 Tax=Halalkalibacter lacteus TaxID=3090663 RepID=UPI002FCC96B6